MLHLNGIPAGEEELDEDEEVEEFYPDELDFDLEDEEKAWREDRLT